MGILITIMLLTTYMQIVKFNVFKSLGDMYHQTRESFIKQ